MDRFREGKQRLHSLPQIHIPHAAARWWECSLAAISQTTTHMHGHHEMTMGLAGVSFGRELRALATPLRCGVAPPENSVKNSRADCALTQQMIGCMDGHQPLREERVGKAVPGPAHHVGTEWRGQERTLDAAAQVERAALCLRRFSGAHSRVCGGCAAEAAVSEASGPRVSGCIRAPRYFYEHTDTGHTIPVTPRTLLCLGSNRLRQTFCRKSTNVYQVQMGTKPAKLGRLHRVAVAWRQLCVKTKVRRFCATKKDPPPPPGSSLRGLS